MTKGNHVRVKFDALAEAYFGGGESSAFVGMTGVLATGYVDSVRGYLLLPDDVEMFGDEEIPFSPEELEEVM